MNVAIYLTGVNDISGGGGVERFFAEFFSQYDLFLQKKFKLYLFCDLSTYNALSKTGRLNIKSKHIVLLINVSNRFKNIIEYFDFFFKVIKYRIDIIHCANYSLHDYSRLYKLSKFTFFKKIILIFNVVDCTIPYVLRDKYHPNKESYKRRFIDEPKKIGFKGIFSWYKLFCEYAQSEGGFLKETLMYNITSRFVDSSKFMPEKEKAKSFIFASRMDMRKNPDWFIKAILELKQRKIDELKDWTFLFIGKGECQDEMDSLIKKLEISDMVKREESSNLSTIFAKTSCFISTQIHENFPSMSMMEAMACGNAIITRNVGQTELMVKDGYNGIFLKKDDYVGLADTMEEFIKLSNENRKLYQSNSINLIKNVHNFESFTAQIESFWTKLINK